MKHTITVGLPNGQKLKGEKEGELLIPGPQECKIATILPEMTNMSLLSVGTFCDAGMQVIFDKDKVKFIKENKQVMEGNRNPKNKLWTMPLTAETKINNITKIKSIGNMMKYLHMVMFSPALETLKKVIKKGYFKTWPGFTVDNVNKYLVETDATIKGHMRQNKRNQMSTKHNTQDERNENDKQTKSHEVYTQIYATNKMYSDQTGRFPQISSQGNQYIYMAYIYDANAIIAIPIKSRKGEALCEAHRKMVHKLERCGFMPKMHWLDNEAPSMLKEFNKNEDITFQLTPPNIHRRNAAERAIQTWKNHFISGLCSTHPLFPMHLWDRLIEQANMTLNMMRTCRVHPQLSAYEALFGTFDFNSTPLDPPGCKVLILQHPSMRASWDARAKDAWYVGPAMEHYRCYKCYVPESRGIRISESVKFQPHTCETPYTTNTDIISQNITELTTVLKQYTTNESKTFEALKTLHKTLNKHAGENNRQTRVQGSNSNESPRVKLVQATQLPRVRPPAPHTYHTRSKTKHNNVMNTIICEETGKQLEYRHLIKQTKVKERWTNSFSNELGRLAQGRRSTNLEGTNTIFFIEYESIPTSRKKDITYGRIVVDYRPQKQEPHRTRLTVGGNLINYPDSVATKTAEVNTAKLLFNSVISTPKAKFACVDIGNFYLGTKMERYEYMFLPLDMIPKEIIEQYRLTEIARNGKVYLEIRKGMYGLPQSGKLANEQLQRNLEPYGYTPCKYTPGLWKHKTRPKYFTLVVDDFGIKYQNKTDIEHLISTLKRFYPKITVDWEGKLYCGITLNWDYNKRTVELSMPGYVEEVLHKYQHIPPQKPQHSPHKVEPVKYGAKVQYASNERELEELPKNAKIRIQQIVGSLLYYARTIDITMLPALSTISREQSKPTVETAEAVTQLLDYCATHPKASIKYRASDMILKVHSDASYLSERGAMSRVGGYYYLGDLPPEKQDFNGSVHTVSNLLKNIVTSAAEAEYGGLFVNARIGIPMRIALNEMGHKQLATPIITDNSTALGIANDTIKQRHSKAMNMRFHYIRDQVKEKNFTVTWQPGETNAADYFTKHHTHKHHQKMRSKYLCEANMILQGCIKSSK